MGPVVSHSSFGSVGVSTPTLLHEGVGRPPYSLFTSSFDLESRGYRSLLLGGHHVTPWRISDVLPGHTGGSDRHYSSR